MVVSKKTILQARKKALAFFMAPGNPPGCLAKARRVPTRQGAFFLEGAT